MTTTHTCNLVSPSDPSPLSCLLVVHRPIPSEEGRCVGSDGVIWSRRKPGRGVELRDEWRPLKQTINTYGYGVVCFGPGKTRLVHRIVLESFVGPCPEGMECRHINGRRWDNRIANLAWGTPEENMADKFRHGTNRLQSLRGERNGRSKLTADQVNDIRRLHGSGSSCAMLADRFGVRKNAIWEIVSGKTWAPISA